MTNKTGFILSVILSLTTVFTANFSGPIFNDKVTDVKVIAGQTAILPCTAHNKGHHKIIWMNPKRILFSNDEKIVIEDTRVSVTRPSNGDWNLQIAHARYNDSGEYLCQINTSPVKIKRVFLYVQVPPHILNSQSSSDMDVEEGDDLELRCKATGVPEPNISWFWRSLLITDGKEKLTTEGEKLFLPKIQRYQSGMYICLANNEVPPAVNRPIEIKVQYPPVVKLLNTRLGQVIGKETMLECIVTSYPRAKVAWIKNGVEIEHSYKYRLELFPGEYDTVSLTLLISYVNVHDFGDYTCEARNRMGIDRKTMVLYEYRDPTETAPESTTVRRTTTLLEPEYYYSEEFYGEYNSDRMPPLPDTYHTGSEIIGKNSYYGETKSGCLGTYHNKILTSVPVLFIIFTINSMV